MFFFMLTDQDIYLFKEGKHYRLYEKLGSHITDKGVFFGVWAPNAKSVSVVGDFNGWNTQSHPLNVRWDGSGIFEGFIPGLGQGTLYKYNIDGVLKGDPFAFYWETPPRTASIVWDTQYSWKTQEWALKREKVNHLDSPISIYELHFGSWRRVPEEDNRPLTYIEMAKDLPAYLKDMGFTHVEFMPIMEHPFGGSWGYQKIGYFAPSSRFGTPQDFMYLIDQLHQNDIGVILDWVPSHFPSDEHGLNKFDGTHLYEHEDPQKGFHPDWKSQIFNYGRNEVRSFLISSALFWCDKYQVDGIRVDAVASMLYLDYSRKPGEWSPNVYGGNENLEAVSFLKELNECLYGNYPYIQTYAEESTAWPMVSRPTYLGGLGFGLKWNMGWMHDTLLYFTKDPIHRKYHHNELTFSIIYAFNENFVLPLSHDEVVHGKASLLSKMRGDDWQKFANLRLLYGYMFLHPGKKLLFMGSEIASWSEWDHDQSLNWNFLHYDRHTEIQKWVRDLNKLYRSHPALYEYDFNHQGFEWIDINDRDQSVISFLRKGKDPDDLIMVVCNFTPLPRHNYKLPVPKKGLWKEICNSDSSFYGGTNVGNLGLVKTYTYAQSPKISLILPPLAIICFKFLK